MGSHWGNLAHYGLMSTRLSWPPILLGSLTAFPSNPGPDANLSLGFEDLAVALPQGFSRNVSQQVCLPSCPILPVPHMGTTVGLRGLAHDASGRRMRASVSAV